MQKLIMLGILKDGPKHGYQIKKIIQKDMGVFSQLDTQSIYYPLKKMEEEGLIRKQVAKIKGRLPRYIYTITPHGNKEFLNLALQALLSKKRPFIDIDIPLYFLPYLDKKEVMARLRLRKIFLGKAKNWLNSKLGTINKSLNHRRLLLSHHLNLLNAEENFLGEIIRVIKG
ncbi:MAG: PadR family transcriptional regulator [Candidatus Omnitrophota bacterium]|nr:PadR family transcriptional regulator [Candidatus Omnitrophota bacterium]